VASVLIIQSDTRPTGRTKGLGQQRFKGSGKKKSKQTYLVDYDLSAAHHIIGFVLSL